jgi:glycosyltransferase involved in cell wall biosynthesis
MPYFCRRVDPTEIAAAREELNRAMKPQRSGFEGHPLARSDSLSRIAVVTSHFPPSTGGLERHASALAEAIAKRGVTVDVIVPGSSTARHQLSEHPGITIRRFPILAGASRYSLSPGLWRYLRRAARTYDLVHAHNFHALPALAAALADARALVVTPLYHGAAHSLAAEVLNVPYRRAARIIFDRAHAVICVSNAEASLVTTHFPVTAGKVKVIYSGLDVDALRAACPLPTNGRIVLTAGRLERYKRVDLILDALRFLPPEWRLVVIGHGRDRRRLERRVESSGLTGRAYFMNPVGDGVFRSWLKTAEVYVSMSAHESFGLAVAEAITAGAGLVASDIPPHREVVRLLGAKRFALLARDSGPIPLAEAVLQTGRGPAQLAQSGRLSWERVADETFEVYETVLRQTLGRSPVRS